MSRHKVHARKGQNLSGEIQVWCGRKRPMAHASSDALVNCKQCKKAEAKQDALDEAREAEIENRQGQLV